MANDQGGAGGGGIDSGAGISFSYPGGTMNVRLKPNAIHWTYNLNVNVVDTYAGQVIQVLGINVGQLIIEGQFGKEGPFGKKRGDLGWVDKSPSERWVPPGELPYGTGLTEMTAFFREYFQESTQVGLYEQIPMTITYDSNIAHMTNTLDNPPFADWQAASGTWLAIPVEFPSYHRSNEDFAPEWKVVCEVVQVPLQLEEQAIGDALSRLQASVGFDPLSPWSAPAEEVTAAGVLSAQIEKDISLWHRMLPDFTVGDLDNLIYFEASTPTSSVLQNVGAFAGGLSSRGGGGSRERPTARTAGNPLEPLDTAVVSGGVIIDTGGIPRNPPGV
jgi:hypothetical protein